MEPKEKYDLIRNAVEDNLRLTTGAEEDRLLGLQPLLDQGDGATILDIGCHIGAVAEAFARRGAGPIHGVDIYRPGLRTASERLRPYKTEALFRSCDLTGGIPALKQAIPALRSSYDIVLYLGMHHHLVHQMPSEQLNQFTSGLMDVAGTFCAVRTSAKQLAELHDRFSERQFELWSRHEDYPRPVGPIRIYRRRT